MEVEVSWFGDALLQQDLARSLSHNPLWILHYIRRCLRNIWDHLSKNWRWGKTGPCNMSMIQNIPVNPPRTGWKVKKLRVLEWPSQSPDLNPIEMLWGDLKQTVHARNPSNITQLKEFCFDELVELSSSWCQRLADGYKKRLIEVISAKRGKH